MGNIFVLMLVEGRVILGFSRVSWGFNNALTLSVADPEGDRGLLYLEELRHLKI